MAKDAQVLIIGDYYDVPRQRLIDQYPCAIYEDAADPAAFLAEIAPTCRAIASHAPLPRPAAPPRRSDAPSHPVAARRMPRRTPKDAPPHPVASFGMPRHTPNNTPSHPKLLGQKDAPSHPEGSSPAN